MGWETLSSRLFFASSMEDSFSLIKIQALFSCAEMQVNRR